MKRRFKLKVYLSLYCVALSAVDSNHNKEKASPGEEAWGIDMLLSRISLSAVLVLLVSASTSAAGDLAYGEYLAGECVACHRVNSETAIPPINALPAPYFVEALKEYRDGERDHELMRTVARSLGETEMEALAAYFEQLDVQN